MGRLIVWNVASLDGYFEGPEPWDLSLHETIWGDELAALSDAPFGRYRSIGLWPSHL